MIALMKLHPDLDRRGDSLRVALYSHDTMGLGHMRRNMLIAQALVQSPINVTALLIAGARECAAFQMPAGVDCLTLPSFYKESNSSYRARGLDVACEALVRLRSCTIAACLDSFEPDVLIVDKVPRGVCGEAGPGLIWYSPAAKDRVHLGATRCA